MAHDEGMFDGIFQFAHVTGQRVRPQQRHGFRRHLFNWLSGFLAEGGNEMIYQQGDIFRALA